MAFGVVWLLLSVSLAVHCRAGFKQDEEYSEDAFGKPLPDVGTVGIFFKDTDDSDDVDDMFQWYGNYDPFVIADGANDVISGTGDDDWYINVGEDDDDADEDETLEDKRRFKGGMRAYMRDMLRPWAYSRKNPAFLGKRAPNWHWTKMFQSSVQDGSRRPSFLGKRGSNMKSFLSSMMRSQSYNKFKPAFLGKRQEEKTGIIAVVPHDMAAQKPRFIGKRGVRDVQGSVHPVMQSTPDTQQKPDTNGQKDVKSRSKRDLKSYVLDLFRAKQGDRPKPRFIGKRDVSAREQNNHLSNSRAIDRATFHGTKRGKMYAFLNNMFRSHSKNKSKPSFLGKRGEHPATVTSDVTWPVTSQTEYDSVDSEKRGSHGKPRFLGKRNS